MFTLVTFTQVTLHQTALCPLWMLRQLFISRSTFRSIYSYNYLVFSLPRHLECIYLLLECFPFSSHSVFICPSVDVFSLDQVFGNIELNPKQEINRHNNFRTFIQSLVLLFRQVTIRPRQPCHSTSTGIWRRKSS